MRSSLDLLCLVVAWLSFSQLTLSSATLRRGRPKKVVVQAVEPHVPQQANNIIVPLGPIYIVSPGLGIRGCLDPAGQWTDTFPGIQWSHRTEWTGRVNCAQFEVKGGQLQVRGKECGLAMFEFGNRFVCRNGLVNSGALRFYFGLIAHDRADQPLWGTTADPMPGNPSVVHGVERRGQYAVEFFLRVEGMTAGELV